MSAVYQPISISKKLASAFSNTHIYQATLFSISRIGANNCNNFCVSHTLFMLYFRGNNTLFSEKSNFISKVTSGNTDMG